MKSTIYYFAFSTVLSMLLLSALPAPSPTTQSAPVDEADDRTVLEPLKESHSRSLFNDDVKIYELNSGHRHIGESIHLARRSQKVKAKYFAFENHDNVYERYQEWKQNKKIILMCAGAFTSGDNSKPVGLTVDNGQIVNRNIENDMDGLVVVYATGGIVASDLEKEPGIYLGSLKKKLNPLQSRDRYEFLDWAEEEDATVFQTQLLVFKNDLRVYTEGRTETASRRILALAQDQSGNLQHIVFNIRSEVFLYDISKEIYDHLQRENMKVIVMLNLDTGSYDILQVFDESGDRIQGIHGDRDIRPSKATNLVAYYYDE
ncbi:MAG: hypothetical protein AAGG75_14940 [Bacteroidota bacterium]